ncbi:MAG: hypothetical protein AAFN93_13710, partial [Bacteroidota bacterium]
MKKINHFLSKSNVSKFCFAIVLVSFCALTNLQAQNCTVNADVGRTLCANENLTLAGVVNGLFQSPATWSQTGGPSVIINDPSNLSTSISGLEFVGGNDITFTLSAVCQDGSPVAQSVTFTITPITTADAGSDLGSSCPGGSFTLSGNSPGANESGEWTSSGAGVSIDDPTNPNSPITLSASSSGTATLTWTITNTNGCSSASSISIDNLGGESPVDAGPDQNLSNCYTSTQSTSLAASYGGDGTGGQIGTWTIVDGPNLPTINDVNNNSTNISNLMEGTYTFQWTVSGICISGSDEVIITVPAATQDVTVANAGPNVAFCDTRTSTVLSGNVPAFAGETVEWTLVSSPGNPDPDLVIVNPTSPVTEITGLNGSGRYRFRYTITNTLTSCDSDDVITIDYIDYPTLTVNGGDDFIQVS